MPKIHFVPRWGASGADSISRVSAGCMRVAFSFSRLMASYTSCRCTGISWGAWIPSRTLSPRMSTIVTTTSSPIMILSSRRLDNTNIPTNGARHKAKNKLDTKRLLSSLREEKRTGGGTNYFYYTQINNKVKLLRIKSNSDNIKRIKSLHSSMDRAIPS